MLFSRHLIFASLKFREINVSRKFHVIRYIQSSLSEVTLDIRQSALKPQKQNTVTAERLLPFVTTYHPTVKRLKQIVMENWNFIENQPLLKTVFKTPPVISYRRGKSLKAKADVLSVSPLSERIEELWVVCGLYTERWSYAIGWCLVT